MSEWKKVSGDDRDAQTPFQDPYVDWAMFTQYEFMGGKPKSFPILLELNSDLKSFASLQWDSNNESKAWLALPPDFKHPRPPLDQSRFAVAVVTEQFFIEIRNLSKPLAKVVKRYEMGTPIATLMSVEELNTASDKHASFAKQQTPSQHPKANAAQATASIKAPVQSTPAPAAPSVIVGVIDDGLAFANERFAYYSAGQRYTRIEALWAQDLLPQTIGFPGALSGWTLDAAAINQLFKTSVIVGGTIDEDAVYRKAGLDMSLPGHKSIARRAAHGTHVMDLACGLDPNDPATAHGPRIVAVQLPDIVTEQTSGALLTPHVYAGIWFILLNALVLSPNSGQPIPVVINLSYGTTSGPHDGTSLLESAMDAIVRLCWNVLHWRVTIVLPSGNSHLGRVHAVAALPPGKGVNAYAPVPFPWRVLPDDRTPSHVEIWLPCDAAYRDIELEVETPTGDRSPAMVEGSTWVWPAGSPRAFVRFIGFSALGSRRVAIICLYPTATIIANRKTAPSGLWKIWLRSNSAQYRVVEGRVRRDDNALGYPIVGRQSHFEHPAYQRFGKFGLPEQNDLVANCVVLRAGSINGIATGNEPVVVAGCRFSDLDTAPYSGAGPVNRPQGCAWPPRIFGADVMAPSEHSVACGGVLASGTRSHSMVAIDGTSVAAPQVTRRISELLGGGSPGDRTAAILEAIMQEISRLGRIPPLKPIPNAMRAGAGRLQLPASKLPAANGKRPPQY